MNFLRSVFETGYIGNVLNPISSALRIPSFILAGLIISLIPLLIYFAKRLFYKKKNDLVLILGLTNAGKTTLFYLLKTAEFVRTRASQEENSGEFEIYGTKSRKVYKVIDSPGHYRVRNTYKKHLKLVPKKIVFVLDSATFGNLQKDIIPFFYEVLSSEVVMDNLIPISVICNKCDVYGSTGASTIIRRTENEIQQLIEGKSKVFGEDQERVVVNDVSLKFSFKENCRTPVKFIHCSLKSDSGFVDRIIEFIGL